MDEGDAGYNSDSLKQRLAFSQANSSISSKAFFSIPAHFMFECCGGAPSTCISRDFAVWHWSENNEP